MARPPRLASQRVETRAFVLRRTQVGDADLMIALFTEELGRMTASARGARRPSSKLGALEPIHTLRVGLEVRPGKDIARLADARIDAPRLQILSRADELDAAFRMLVWLRSVLQPLQPERRVFAIVSDLFDALDRGSALGALAAAGFGVLAALGYRLDLTACVRCGTECPADSSAWIDPREGGLVCRSCAAMTGAIGGRSGRFLVKAALRRAMDETARGRRDAIDEDDAATALAIVEATFAAHAASPIGDQAPRSR